MKTVLYEKHEELGAKIEPFFGWEMPIYYSGVIEEHQAVRSACGLFDVSHMGRVMITGKEAEQFLDYISTNKIVGKKDGSATYTVWCKADGSAVDDCIVYRQKNDKFFVVVNAGNREKDLQYMRQQSETFDVQITPRYEADGILALQGKAAPQLMEILFPEALGLKFMRLMESSFNGETLVISRTGYTGSPGFELFAPLTVLPALWDRILEAGAPLGIQPIGLGARDTLRLEMGFALYGHELSEKIKASETVSAWTIKLSKENFLGKEALETLEASGEKRVEQGVVMLDRGVPREGYQVMQKGERIGEVTSGGHSPTLKKGVAIVLFDHPLELGERVHIQVRTRQLEAEVVKLPFIDPNSF